MNKWRPMIGRFTNEEMILWPTGFTNAPFSWDIHLVSVVSISMVVEQSNTRSDILRPFLGHESTVQILKFRRDSLNF